MSNWGHALVWCLSTLVVGGTTLVLLAELHESSIRAYKVTRGSKGVDHPAVSVVRLSNVPKHSRLPFTGSEISLQLMSTGQSRLPPLPSKTFVILRGFLSRKLCENKE